MSRRCVIGLLAAFMIAVTVPPWAEAQTKKVEITKKWSGSVDDEKAKQPDAIVSAKGLEAIWKEWKVQGEMPKVDFTKDIIVAVYSVGSSLNMGGANLDANGNLDVIGFGTRDIRPGFRYVLGIVSRDGVKTVNKKALPEQ